MERITTIDSKISIIYLSNRYPCLSAKRFKPKKSYFMLQFPLLFTYVTSLQIN